MKPRYLNSIILFLLVLLIPNAVDAQNEQTVRGDVRAPDASPVTGVDVLLTSENQEKPRSSETDEEGMFEFPKVAPGKYVLRVEVPGFEPVEKPIEVGSEPVPRIRLKLKIAEVSDKVTVSGQSVLLAEENRGQARFDEHMVMHLPARDANPLVVPSLFLHPAVVGASGPTIIVDGVETSSLDLPTSSVKSVTVDQNPYSPEFGFWSTVTLFTLEVGRSRELVSTPSTMMVGPLAPTTAGWRNKEGTTKGLASRAGKCITMCSSNRAWPRFSSARRTDCPLTVTLSLTSAILSFSRIRGTGSEPTSMGVSTGPQPGTSTRRTYFPGATLGNSNMPSSSVSEERGFSWVSLVSRTSTPVTGEASGARTSPLTVCSF